MAENKQYITQVQDNGRVMISEDVISTIVIQSLADIEGYVGLSAKPGSDIIELIGKKNWGKGIKVTISENDELTVDCNVVISYGHSVVAVATAIQEAVCGALQSMTGVSVVSVNVNVCGIVRQEGAVMTRANARELAVHLIYGRDFTGEEPEQVVSVRLAKEYYAKLSEENDVYSERPSRAQMAYLDKVVSGVANRADDLNAEIQKYSIGWDVSRISRLTRAIMQLAIFEILYVEDVPTGVAISEAVRLAKKYDGDDTGSFVNGILGTYARSLSAEEAE